MSIFDSFFITFKSNAKDVQKEIESTKKTADQFQEKLNESDKAASKLAESFLNLTTAAIGAAASYFTFDALKDGVLGAARYNAELEKMNRLTGLSAEELAKWDAAVVHAGGSAGTFINWITQYAAKLQEMGQGDKIANITDDLLKLADVMQKMNTSDALALGAKLGIPPEVVLVMKDGSAALTELLQKQADLNTVSKESTQIAREFESSYSDAANAVKGVTTAMGDAVLPFFTHFLKIITEVANFLKAFPTLLGNNVFNFIEWLMPLKDGKKRKREGAFDYKATPPAAPGAPPDTPAGIEISPDGVEGGKEKAKPLLKKQGAAPGGSMFAGTDTDMLSRAKAGIAEADASPLNSASTHITDNRTVNVGNVTIQTQATDSKEIARSFSDQIKDMLRGAMVNHDDGVEK